MSTSGTVYLVGIGYWVVTVTANNTSASSVGYLKTDLINIGRIKTFMI